jgi:thiamine biosynthesis lipoprotein
MTSGSAGPAGALLQRHESRAMGSPLRLTLAASDGDEAWTAVRDEFERAEVAMSRFRATSELTRLNATAGSGRLLVVSGRLRAALAAAERARRVTGGRFDPRVLDDLERLGYRGAALAAAEPGVTPRELSGTAAIRRAGRWQIGLDRAIDLGGIGKGLTLRWAAARLERLGLTDFLLDAGGDIVARGVPPDAGAWTIAIEDPLGRGPALAAIAVPPTGGAVATSSVRVHRWQVDGRTVHHLLDPATGEPATTGLLAVTVAGSDPAWSEVWSKTLFLAGADAIAGEARGRGLAAWWVDVDGTLAMTPAARVRTAWVAAEDAFEAGAAAGPDTSPAGLVATVQRPATV